MKFSPSQPIYTVSRLNKAVKELLEGHFLQIWLEGEVSNLIQASSGHWYFKLKDDRAQVQCAMFKGSNRFVNFNVKNGDQVLLKAKISLYEPRGDYQIIADKMESAGEGKLKQAFEQLKFKLAAKGLFAQQTKQLLPKNIEKIGVVTSPTGAAIEDILTVLARRAKHLEVILYPTLVQGELAAPQIVNAIHNANVHQTVDVLIIGRGGGSLEDLWSFNEEAVAKAIFNSRIPTISAVGHEIDNTISDLVADVRAATPSAAAELASQFAMEITNKHQQHLTKIHHLVSDKVNQLQQKLSFLELKLNKQDPKQALLTQQQKIDEYQFRMQALINKKVTAQQSQLQKLNVRLERLSPQLKLTQIQQQQQQLQSKLNNLIQAKVNDVKQRLILSTEKLEAYSPLATLARGYNIALTKQGAVIKSCQQINPKESFILKMHDGDLTCQVSEIHKNADLNVN